MTLLTIVAVLAGIIVGGAAATYLMAWGASGAKKAEDKATQYASQVLSAKLQLQELLSHLQDNEGRLYEYDENDGAWKHKIVM